MSELARKKESIERSEIRLIVLVGNYCTKFEPFTRVNMGTHADFSLFYTYSAKPSDSLAGQEVEVTTALSPSLPFSIAMTYMMGNSFQLVFLSFVDFIDIS